MHEWQFRVRVRSSANKCFLRIMSIDWCWGFQCYQKKRLSLMKMNGWKLWWSLKAWGCNQVMRNDDKYLALNVYESSQLIDNNQQQSSQLKHFAIVDVNGCGGILGRSTFHRLHLDVQATWPCTRVLVWGLAAIELGSRFSFSLNPKSQQSAGPSERETYDERKQQKKIELCSWSALW